jgi:tetrapyrrole methylase family protein/MazG family protein
MSITIVGLGPGDPVLGDESVSRFLDACAERGIQVEMVSRVGHVDSVLAALNVDIAEGLQVVDSASVAGAYHPPINPDIPALVLNISSAEVLISVQRVLLNQYPDHHHVRLVTPTLDVSETPLSGLTQHRPVFPVALFIPPYLASGDQPQPGSMVTSFEGFQSTVAHLRAPDGCPWDRKQTHQSLRQNLIEEAYEVVDAIDSGDVDHVREELGDLLMQVVIHAQIATDDGEFRMADIIRGIDAKLKRRHPHVWGSVDVNGDTGQVLANWEEIKAQERADKGEQERSLLDGVSQALPALSQGHEYDVRAIRVGFDWPDVEGVVDKVHEEIAEILAAQTPGERLHEIGDLLLAVVVWARWLDVHPEDALRAANRRFYERFTYIERKAREQGRTLQEMSLDEMDALWNEIKAHQNNTDQSG